MAVKKVEYLAASLVAPWDLPTVVQKVVHLVACSAVYLAEYWALQRADSKAGPKGYCSVACLVARKVAKKAAHLAPSRVAHWVAKTDQH